MKPTGFFWRILPALTLAVFAAPCVASPGSWRPNENPLGAEESRIQAFSAPGLPPSSGPAGETAGGWLGVQLSELVASPWSAEGCVVRMVIPDAPAERAGLEVNDLLVRFSGKPVLDTGELIRDVFLTAPGSVVNLTLIRYGKALILPVLLDDRRSAPRDYAPKSFDFLGMVLGRRAHWPEARGLEILRVLPGSPAERAGLCPGMLIRAADGRAFTSPLRLVAELEPAAFGDRADSVILDVEWAGTRFLLKVPRPVRTT